jgi:DNA mismatch repair protein MutS2
MFYFCKVIIHGNDTLRLFEFDKICERIANYCRAYGSRKNAESLQPFTDRDALLLELRQTNEFTYSISGQGYFPDTYFDDFENETELLPKSGSVLSEQQFSLIRSASETVNNILRFMNEREIAFPYLVLLTKGIPVTTEIITMISEIIDAHAIVKDSASDELRDIRSQLGTKRREADRKFRSYITEFKKKGWLRENEENFYNNRRVLAVPSEYRREVNGLTHGKSESGRTIFIEPELLVGLNNEISELEQDERNEVRRLLRELTEKLRIHSNLVSAYHAFLIRIDFIRAKALFARDINGIMPQLSKNSIVQLYNAVHPLLYLQNKAQQKEIIPLNLYLNQEKRILIISGPNAGGKSITLKTVGLLQLMLQSGLLIPAEEKSTMCFFNHFMADIGDSQSIENALSTYSSRLISMNFFLRSANNRSLILIDEFGTGTDPELGGAIAEAVLEELNKRKAFGVFTTHYTNIKLLADQLEGVENGSMLFDPQTLQPKYKLVTGQPGSSYTFEVAERIGLPTHVIQRAKKKVQTEKLKLNSMLSALHSQKNKIEEELRELKAKQEQTEEAGGRYTQLSQKLTEKMERDKEKREELNKLADLGRKMHALAEEWDKTKDKKSVIKKFVGSMTAEKKKKAAENSPQRVAKKRLALLEKLRNEIHVGSKVRIMKSKQSGTVEEIKKDMVYVNFGHLRMQVAMENLELVQKEE